MISESGATVCLCSLDLFLNAKVNDCNTGSGAKIFSKYSTIASLDSCFFLLYCNSEYVKWFFKDTIDQACNKRHKQVHHHGSLSAGFSRSFAVILNGVSMNAKINNDE